MCDNKRERCKLDKSDSHLIPPHSGWFVPALVEQIPRAYLPNPSDVKKNIGRTVELPFDSFPYSRWYQGSVLSSNPIVHERPSGYTKWENPEFETVVVRTKLVEDKNKITSPSCNPNWEFKGYV